MLPNDIVLDSASGVDTTYRLVANDANGTRRLDVATTLAAPATLTIKHNTTGKGGDAVDRHLVQFQRTVVGSDGPVTMTTNLTMAVPRNVAVTPTIVKDEISRLIDFMADGSIASLATTVNIDALLRGES